MLAVGCQEGHFSLREITPEQLARGVPMRALMAEMLGKLEGCCRGRGGSMHLFHREHRFFGGNAIVGGGLPLAVGIAMADKQLRPGAVTGREILAVLRAAGWRAASPCRATFTGTGRRPLPDQSGAAARGLEWADEHREADAIRAVEETVRQLGRIDILINSAGIKPSARETSIDATTRY